MTLGIDRAGRVVVHDRNAGEILAGGADCLLGASLGDLVMDSTVHGSPLRGLLDSIRCGQEATAVLTLRTQGAGLVDAVAFAQPAQASDDDLAALLSLRIPRAGDEHFPDHGAMRHALLDDAFLQMGSTLDLDQLARGLVRVVVLHFCIAAGLLVLESLLAADEPPASRPTGSHVLRRMAFAADDPDPRWVATFPTGEAVEHPPGTPFARCLETGRPVRVDSITTDKAAAIASSSLHGPVGGLTTGSSLLLLPLNTPESTLGFIVCIRRSGLRPFDEYDTEIGMEFASRAAIFIDNARRYNRERATALALQRSLLPIGLSAPSSVEVGHRYLPGGQLIEVGGDWYESIALPGARVALVIGDVAGHGVSAAITMGRLRTAIQTLAMLELPPAESLQQLDELMQTMTGTLEPHFATCAYAVYDAVSGTCEAASAGHLPPLLVRPDGSSKFLDVPLAPPLGVCESLITSQTFDVEDGSLIVLYTDGLVENRSCDIDDGLARLQAAFGPATASRSVDELCKAALASAYADHQRDDIAVLIARLSRLKRSQQAHWVLPSELTSARQARFLVKEPLERWNLTDLLPTTQLLVSELVTNAIRYTPGPVTLRLIQEETLVCEVLDSSPALPRLRNAARDDEGGRGLQVVSLLSHRWGARRVAAGKVVWCEQLPPASHS
jgi:serine phosphatase RsbU (regulator of sigma subunit)